MSCTVFRSTNKVDQAINVFPPNGYVSVIRIVRNYDVENGNVFKFRTDVQKYFKAVGGTITCPALGVIDPVTEIALTSRDIYFKLDEGREFAYLAWKDADRIMGANNDDGGTFYGAYADYTLGLHTAGVISINGICIANGNFNQRVNTWDVSEVVDAAYTFADAINFDREINWYAPKVQWLNNFLYGARKFNKDITLRSAKPASLRSFLDGSTSFNSKINIDTSACADFGNMLAGCTKFNQPLSSFSFKSATNIDNLFYGTKEFNQPIDFGNMLQLTQANYVFAESNFNNTIKFNAPNLISVSGWFSNNTKFNSKITGAFGSVTNMSFMFWYASSFNQPINDWDIRKVETFVGFLTSATSFNQDLSSWPSKFNVNAVIEGVSVAPNWSTENYDKYLNALWLDVGTTRKTEWQNSLGPRTVLASVKRSAASQDAVSGLTGAGWTIIDGGLA
ncbi:BspA family leucine-rich repeat surface protein [Acinetobacter nosocomialis]